MKRRNADCGKIRRPIKRNKITESMHRYASNEAKCKFFTPPPQFPKSFGRRRRHFVRVRFASFIDFVFSRLSPCSIPRRVLWARWPLQCHPDGQAEHPAKVSEGLFHEVPQNKERARKRERVREDRGTAAFSSPTVFVVVVVVLALLLGDCSVMKFVPFCG